MVVNNVNNPHQRLRISFYYSIFYPTIHPQFRMFSNGWMIDFGLGLRLSLVFGSLVNPTIRSTREVALVGKVVLRRWRDALPAAGIFRSLGMTIQKWTPRIKQKAFAIRNYGLSCLTLRLWTEISGLEDVSHCDPSTIREHHLYHHHD